MFGITLAEVMELQEEKHPELPVPWVIVQLFESVLNLGGPQSEGIFRYFTNFSVIFETDPKIHM